MIMYASTYQCIAVSLNQSASQLASQLSVVGQSVDQSGGLPVGIDVSAHASIFLYVHCPSRSFCLRCIRVSLTSLSIYVSARYR